VTKAAMGFLALFLFWPASEAHFVISDYIPSPFNLTILVNVT
jgi:hypothetical protein